MCRVFLNDRLDELEKLKNTFTVFEPVEAMQQVVRYYLFSLTFRSLV